MLNKYALQLLPQLLQFSDDRWMGYHDSIDCAQWREGSLPDRLKTRNSAHKIFMIDQLRVSQAIIADWDARSHEAQNVLSSSRAMLDASREGLLALRADKNKARRELRALLASVKDAAALCRIASSMRLPAPELCPAPQPSGAALPAESVNETHLERAGFAPLNDLESLLEHVVPSPFHANNERDEAAHKPVSSRWDWEISVEESPSPRARLPTPMAAPEPPLPGGIREDDLVVLLLKRQLQRRELELQQLLREEGQVKPTAARLSV